MVKIYIYSREFGEIRKKMGVWKFKTQNLGLGSFWGLRIIRFLKEKQNQQLRDRTIFLSGTSLKLIG